MHRDEKVIWICNAPNIVPGCRMIQTDTYDEGQRQYETFSRTPDYI